MLCRLTVQSLPGVASIAVAAGGSPYCFGISLACKREVLQELLDLTMQERLSKLVLPTHWFAFAYHLHPLAPVFSSSMT